MSKNKIQELWDNKKELLKNKKVRIIGASVLAGVIALGAVGYIIGMEDSKVVDNSKDRKEDKVLLAEKEDTESKLNEFAKEEENKIEEEQKVKEEKKAEEEQNKEVAANNENNTSQNDSGSNSSSSGGSNNNSGNGNSNSGNGGGASNPAPTPVPTPTPPVVEQPKPDPIPTPEPPKPVYPSVAEVKQRLISYGQSIGLTYDPSISSSTEGTVMQGTDQMWDAQLGYSGVTTRLLEGIKVSGCYAFNVEVIDLGNGFCSMKAYGIMNWD